MKSAAILLALQAPSFGLALIGNGWAFEECPSQGLNDVTFPFNIATAPQKSGYYFAQQFYFNNVEQGAYAGLQPRENSNGQAIVHAVFSSFANGTTTGHPNCYQGADGAAEGVSCALEVPGDYSHTFNVVVENVGSTYWRGTLVDTTTGQTSVIGEWTLPDSSGKIENGSSGFVEYYNWNDGRQHACNTLPKTQASFFFPTTRTNGAGGGRITDVYEYGDCVGKVQYSATEVGSGYDIKVGVA